MIDTTNAKWELSKPEQSAIDWFTANGFVGEILKQYVSKTVFRISKDGICDTFELPQSVTPKTINDFMEQYRKQFDILKLINQKEQKQMKSLDYLEEIKKRYALSNEDLSDILTHIGYIARDNEIDDTITEELIDALNE
jgi:hypothetical protein